MTLILLAVQLFAYVVSLFYQYYGAKSGFNLLVVTVAIYIFVLGSVVDLAVLVAIVKREGWRARPSSLLITLVLIMTVAQITYNPVLNWVGWHARYNQFGQYFN